MSKKIKILHVVGKRPKGGIGTFLINITKYMDKEKFEFDFLINGTVTPGEFDKRMLELGSNVYVLPELKYRSAFHYIKELKSFYNCHHEYDIVHIHSPNITVFNYYFLKKYPSIKIAVHSHSTKYSDKFINSLRNFFLYMPIKRIADLYFACNISSAKFLFGRNKKTINKVIIVHNGIEIDKFTFSDKIRERIKKDLGVENNLIIGHVGAFVPVKNHEFIINVFKQILEIEKNAILILVGDGDLENKIRNKVDELKISPFVKFLGRRHDVQDIMQAFDLFLMPSRFEGMPLVGIEAQTTGLACFFSTSVPNEIKIIEDVFFYNLDDSPQVWAKQIHNYINDHLNTRDPRIKFARYVKNCGFDIVDTVKVLEKAYYEQYKK
jgi:glycosyltransferase involved in cell wall biosynthesis